MTCTLRNAGEGICPGEDVVVQARRVPPHAGAQASQDTDACRSLRNLSGWIHPETDVVGFLSGIYFSHSQDFDGRRAHCYIAIKRIHGCRATQRTRSPLPELTRVRISRGIRSKRLRCHCRGRGHHFRAKGKLLTLLTQSVSSRYPGLSVLGSETRWICNQVQS